MSSCEWARLLNGSSCTNASRRFETNQYASPLLLLPPELRYRIYKYVFYGYIQVYAGWYANWNKQWQSKLSFLYTCHQIRFESTLIFYNTTTFDFELLFQIENFAYRVWGQRLWAIRSIRLFAHSVKSMLDPVTADSVLWIGVFPGLEELRVQGDIDKVAQEVLRTLKLRKDGNAIRVVFENR